MKSILSFVILLSGLVAGSSTAITDSELSLGGIALGDSESQVSTLLGKPQKRSDTGEGIALEYPGLTVLIGWLEQATPGKQRHVIQLKATDSRACTPSGVCPGTSIAQALVTYGQPIKVDRESDSFLEYYSNQSSCWLQLGTSGETVRTISAMCQP